MPNQGGLDKVHQERVSEKPIGTLIKDHTSKFKNPLSVIDTLEQMEKDREKDRDLKGGESMNYLLKAK